MGINVTTSKQQITASVADDKIVANVTGGFGATGPSGVITVAAPITNSGTTTAANIGLAIGTGLSVSGGSLVVTPGTYATLVNGTVPAEQLPSYVDDVLEYANLASFPVTGESGKIYVALNSGKCYRWSGSAYFEISTQPGDTDAVPEGSTNLYFTNARARNAFGSGTTGQVLTWSGGQWTAGNAYTLPTASVSTLGGVKIGSGISIDGDGVISASAAYTLPTATNSVLGGVKIGSGVTITDGVISVSTNYAAASHTHAISDVTNLSTTLSGIDSAISGKAGLTANTFTGRQTLQATSSEYTPFVVSYPGVVAGDTMVSVGYNAAQSRSGDYATLTVYGSIAAPYADISAALTVGGQSVVVDNDSRLSDARTPLSHAHSATADLTFAGATAGQVLTVNSGATALVWATPTTYTLPQATGSTLGGITVSTGLSVASGALSVSYGTTSGTACQGNDARLSDARTPTSHTHGNITTAGAIGSTANLPVITTTSGVLTTGTFGTAANSFCQGNDGRLNRMHGYPASFVFG